MSGVGKPGKPRERELSAMDQIKMLGDEAGVSGNELADYIKQHNVIEAAISRVEAKKDKNQNDCVYLYLIGEVFEGRTITQKYTRTQARELNQAFVALNPDYAKGKTIEGEVFQWELGIQPGSTQHARLKPVKAI